MAKQTYEALFLLSGQLASSFGSTFKGASKHFEQLKGAATGFNNAVVGGFKSVGSALTSIPAQMAGLGAGVGLAAMGKHAIDLAADMEKLGTAMTVHLGSASKAQALIAQIQAFATETPFEFKELATAGKQMLAFGFAGDQVVTNLRMLGDVASGLSMPIGDLVYLFGTLKAQGRAFQSDINQFTNRGIPIYDALTKSMKEAAKAQGELTIRVGEGKKAMDVPLEQFSEKNLRAMVEAGQIGFEEINKAFQQLTGEGGKFFGMIEAQSQTFGGRLSTMKDNVNNLFLQMGQPVIDTISPWLAQLNESPVWANMATGIKDQLTPAIKALGDALKGDLGQSLMKLGQDFMAFASSVGAEIAKMFGGMSKGGDVDWIKTMQGMVQGLGQMFQFLAEHMGTVVPLIGALAAAFVGLQVISVISTAITGLGVALGVAKAAFLIFNAVLLANPIGLVVTAIAALVAGIVLLVQNWEAVSAAVTNAWNAMKEVPILGEFIKQTEQHFVTLVETIKTAWAGLVTFFQSEVGQQVIASLAGIAAAILAAFLTPINQIMTAWNALVGAIKSFDIGAALGGVGKAIGNLNPFGKKAPAEVPKMAAGGFVNHPMLAQIGEAGPEAVIPLSGPKARSRGLLASAASALGMGGGAGGSVMNFTPSIVINGPANPETVGALDKKLRELSRDFLAEWKQAHAQERRLAFG